MKVHTVREPFLCREGQFTPVERELCIGLDYKTLKSTNTFWCYIGKNKKTHYEIDSTEAIMLGSKWTNPKGKTVLILPLKYFKKIDSKWDKEVYLKKEAERMEKITESLFK